MTTKFFKIPLVNAPQEFDITLSEIQLTVITQWNQFIPGWVISFFDKGSSELLISAIPIVAGIDLLNQFGFVGIPGKMIVYTDGDSFADPTYENLGVDSNLYYITEVEDE